MPPAGSPPLDVLVGVESAMLTMRGAAMMPNLCAHHAGCYRTRAAAIRHLPHGHKALAREAALIAKQCPECPDPKPRP